MGEKNFFLVIKLQLINRPNTDGHQQIV